MWIVEIKLLFIASRIKARGSMHSADGSESFHSEFDWHLPGIVVTTVEYKTIFWRSSASLGSVLDVVRSNDMYANEGIGTGIHGWYGNKGQTWVIQPQPYIPNQWSWMDHVLHLPPADTFIRCIHKKPSTDRLMPCRAAWLHLLGLAILEYYGIWVKNMGKIICDNKGALAQVGSWHSWVVPWSKHTNILHIIQDVHEKLGYVFPMNITAFYWWVTKSPYVVSQGSIQR